MQVKRHFKLTSPSFCTTVSERVYKLDGKITEDFWGRKSAEWHAEEEQVRIAICALSDIKPERMLDAVRILELANKAYFLYVRQSPSEKAKLLNLVLSNRSIDAISIYPTYRKPFEVILPRALEQPET
jgi:site-specific DNA recombinase